MTGNGQGLKQIQLLLSLVLRLKLHSDHSLSLSKQIHSFRKIIRTDIFAKITSFQTIFQHISD